MPLERALLRRLTAVAWCAFVIGLLASGRAPAVPANHVIAAAGDIACDTAPGAFDIDLLFGGCKMADTASLVERAHPDAVLALGDEQYPYGTLAEFERSYDRTWGAFKAITHPTPGNHEYYKHDAEGYFAYFQSRAGETGKGWYSFNLGSWHIVALNGNCAFVGGCARGTPQELWLRDDLAGHHPACTLAFWHQPRFSSGGHHSDPLYAPFWDDLYAAHADVVLGGHDHDYERFAPQTSSGTADPNGPVQFVVGTGGKNHWNLHWRNAPNSAVRIGGVFGVLIMELHPEGYTWRYEILPNGTVADSGSAPCHAKPRSSPS